MVLQSRSSKTLHTGLAALAGAILLTACSAPDESELDEAAPSLPQPVSVIVDEDGRPDPSILADEQVLHRGNGEEPETLDPHLAEGVPASNILRDLFEGLTTTTPDGRIVPGAAARWDISRDGLTYTFNLHRDGRWSNGDPVTAEDFVWSFRRAVDPETGASYGRMLSPVRNAEDVLAGRKDPDALGVEALDEHTVQIRLDTPTSYFLGLLTHPTTFPVHRPSVEAHGSSHVRPGKLVSNGAFKLEDWQVRSRIVVVRNEAYRQSDRVTLEEVVFYPLEDESTEFFRFRAGDLHWTYQVPSNRFRWLRRNMNDALSVSPWFGTYYFSFNLTREPFENQLHLRRALNLAVNREILTDRVTQFGELPTFNLIPEGLPGYEPPVPEYAEWDQQRREEEARRQYHLAGYSESDPLTLELRYNTGENHRKIAVSVAAMWKEVLGVRTRLINEEFRVFLQNRAQRRVTQAFRAGWIGDYQDPFTFLELFHSEHGRNDAGYDNPGYDRLLRQISEERVPARRNRLMREAERIVLADQVVMPIHTYMTRRLVDPRLKGWQKNVMDHHPSRYMFFVREQAEDEEPDDFEGAEGRSLEAGQNGPAESESEP